MTWVQLKDQLHPGPSTDGTVDRVEDRRVED